MVKLLKYLKPVWFYVFLTILFVVGQVVCQLYVPDQLSEMSRYMTQMASSPEGTQAYKDAFLGLWKMGGIMLLFVLGTTVCAIIVSFTSSKVASTYGMELRKNVFNKVTSLSLSEYNIFGVSSLMTRTTNDITQVQNVVLMGLRIVVSAPLTLIIAFIMILSKYDPFLTVVLAVTIPLLLIVVVFIAVKVMPMMKSLQKKIDRVTLVMRENLTGIRVIRAFDKQPQESLRFKKANKDLTYLTIKTNRYFSIMMPAIMFIMNLTYLGVFFLGFALSDGKPFLEFMNTFSSFMSVAQYVMQIMMAFMMFAMIFVFISRGTVSARRINEILDLPNSEQYFEMDEETKKTMEENHGLLEFRDVSFSYQNGEEPVLEHISFTAKPNQTTAIIGSTGSGKSTIVNLIPKFFEATSGRVMIDGVDIKKISSQDVRKMISFVPQKALLFKGSIAENLRFGSEEATDEELKEALKVAQAWNFVENKENGLESEVAQGGKNFSGGQKQRLCIARALVRKGEIYVFDDSFSALDFKTDVLVRSALKEYTKGSTIIIVGQRVSSIMDADNIIVLDDGKIVGQGTHNELLQNNKVYQEIVKSQLDPEEVESTRILSQSLKEGSK